MTDTPLLAPPEPPPEAAAQAPAQQRRDLLPWLCGLGFVVLAAAILYLWQYPSAPAESAKDKVAAQVTEQRLADLDARLEKLEQQPTVDTSKIAARLDALEARVADQGQLSARLGALEARVVDQGQLGARLDALSGRLESLSGRDQVGLDAAKQQINALTARMAAIESNAGDIQAVTKRLNRIARLQEASIALAAGRAIGDVPDAPDALARFAHAPPPTEAALRLRFPQAEQAALATHQPDETTAPFVDRLWDRAQGLVTIRRGEDVVVGNSASVVLNRAQSALDAGDLAGAIDAVEALKGPPRQAMAAWLSDAKALLDARTALAQLATHA